MCFPCGYQTMNLVLQIVYIVRSLDRLKLINAALIYSEFLRSLCVVTCSLVYSNSYIKMWFINILPGIYFPFHTSLFLSNVINPCIVQLCFELWVISNHFLFKCSSCLCMLIYPKMPLGNHSYLT